jgi:hypothetical protein
MVENNKKRRRKYGKQVNNVKGGIEQPTKKGMSSKRRDERVNK